MRHRSVTGSGEFANGGTFDAFSFTADGTSGVSASNTGTWNILSGGGGIYLTNNGLIIGWGASFSGTGSFTTIAIGTLEIPIGNGLEFKMNATSNGTVELRGSLFISDSAIFNQTFNIAAGEI